MQSQNSPIRAVLFDFDGTLTEPGAIDFEAIRRAVGCSADQLILEYIQGLPDPAARTHCLEVLEGFEVEAAVASVPNAGAEESVLHLRSLGLRLGILSRNGLRSIERAFANFRLIRASDFEVVISRDVPALPKPAPDGVLLAAAAMGVPVQEMIMVGDYVLDVQAGEAAGAVTVFLDGHWHMDQFGVVADYVIRDLRELETIVQSRDAQSRGRGPGARA